MYYSLILIAVLNNLLACVHAFASSTLGLRIWLLRLFFDLDGSVLGRSSTTTLGRDRNITGTQSVNLIYYDLFLENILRFIIRWGVFARSSRTTLSRRLRACLLLMRRHVVTERENDELSIA